MEEHVFDDRRLASEAAAELLAEHLERRLEGQPRASLIVTGGSSPADCYAALSGKSLDWERTNIVLSDERWVSPTSADSNERLVRETLLKDRAAPATLTPMYADDVSIEAQCERLDETLGPIAVPFSAALLGMGEDGHFASLFPDADNLEEGLDPDTPNFCLPVRTDASPYPRISLTLSAISRSDVIALLIFGDAKKAVLDDAKQHKDKYPVSALIRQKRAPIHVFWAP